MKAILRLSSVFFFTLIALNVAGESLVLNGIYQGKDLYVKNPSTGDGVGFCVYEVLVNGSPTSDEVNSSAFVIDFDILGIKTGSKLEVIINHKKGCAPHVINPESIKPHSTFEMKDVQVSGNTVKWTTMNESGSLPFYVEQFKWNKWVKVGEVKGVGTAESHSYEFKLEPYSGENRVRIKQVDYSTKPRYSDEVAYQPKVSAVTFEPKNPSEEIVFSKATQYEIFDHYGAKVQTGYGQTVDVTALKKGEYYLNYDSSFGETFKKK